MNHSVDNLSITSLSMSPSTYSNSTIISPSYSSVHMFTDSLLSDSMEYFNQKNTKSDRKSKKSKHTLSLSMDSTTSNDDSFCAKTTRSKKGETKSKSKSKTKSKRKTKRKSKHKHRKSHKKSAENNSNSNNIIHDRKLLRIDDDIDSEIRISYIVSRSSFRVSINFGIENKCGGILKNIRLKWYTINNKQQNILLSKVIQTYEYDSRIHHLYFDVDGHKYDNNILICKLKYTFIGLDSWQELEKIPKKSEKFKLKL